MEFQHACLGSLASLNRSGSIAEIPGTAQKGMERLRCVHTRSVDLPNSLDRPVVIVAL